jgi:hypothetical protein
MTEQQATSEGLNFTGIYSFNKDEVKTRIAGLRKEFPKARIVLVNVPHSKLSRSGPGMGCSAYADNVYRAYDTIKSAGDVQASYIARVKYIQDNAAKELADAEAWFTKTTESIKAARELINS